MIDLPLMLAFLVAATILTVTPGVDTAMVLRAATVDGRRPAIAASIGIVLGCLVWGGAVSLGLGALLRASEMAYTVVKLAGAVYLIWLGVRLLMRPRAAITTDAKASDVVASDVTASDMAGSDNASAAFWRGLLTNLLNPKIGVFYITFLPQFVPVGASVAGYSFFLAVVHVLLTLAWFAVLIAATVPLGQFLRRPAAVKALDRLTGGVFVMFGLKLALSGPVR